MQPSDPPPTTTRFTGSSNMQYGALKAPSRLEIAVQCQESQSPLNSLAMVLVDYFKKQFSASLDAW